MWLFLWFLFAAFIIGVFAWTQYILYEQKKTWREFAKAADLNYQKGRFLGSPAIFGTIRDIQVFLYTEAQPTPDARGERFVTVMEFEMGSGMPTGATFATPEYKDFLSTVEMKKSFKPDIPEWKPEYIVKTHDPDLARQYLNEKRAKTVASLFEMKNSSCVFLFDEVDSVLRVETTDPLRNLEHMKKIFKRMLAAVDVLRATAEEKSINQARKDVAEQREVERKQELERLAQERAQEAKNKKPADESLPQGSGDKKQPYLRPADDKTDDSSSPEADDDVPLKPKKKK